MKYIDILKNLLKENKVFFINFFVFLFVGGIIYFAFNRDELLFYFNQNHNFFLNHVFIISTNLAQELGIIPVLIILLLFRYSLFILSSLSLIITTLTVSIIKTITALPRPILFFEHNSAVHLNLIDGVNIHRFMSFPSGHTAAAFAMFLILAHFFKNNYAKHICFFLALLVAISRVYLLQHFFRDVYFAAIIGTLISIILFMIAYQLKWFVELDKKAGLYQTIFKK